MPHSAAWLVYILLCADGSLYCGSTSDLPRRLEQHNGTRTGGARYTAGRRPVRVAASRICGDKSTALRLEAAVKKCKKEEKIRFLLEYALPKAARS